MSTQGKSRVHRLRAWTVAPVAACAMIAAIMNGCSAPAKQGVNMPATSTSFPLPGAKLCAFSATTDAARCREFYVGKLGLRLVHEDGYGLVLDSGGTMLRIQKGPEITPVPRTVLGWNVGDIEEAVAGLVGAGVEFERFTWFKQDEKGITTFPDGSKVAWFKDPDGNILSVAQVAYR